MGVGRSLLWLPSQAEARVIAAQAGSSSLPKVGALTLFGNIDAAAAVYLHIKEVLQRFGDVP